MHQGSSWPNDVSNLQKCVLNVGMRSRSSFNVNFVPKFSAKNVATGIELSPLYQNSRDCVVSNVILNLSSSLTIRYYFSYSSIFMRKRKNLLMFLILPGIKSIKFLTRLYRKRRMYRLWREIGGTKGLRRKMLKRKYKKKRKRLDFFRMSLEKLFLRKLRK